MNIFLTGGTGFIGSYVTLELVKHNHKATILARNPNKIPEFKKIKHEKCTIGYRWMVRNGLHSSLQN